MNRQQILLVGGRCCCDRTKSDALYKMKYRLEMITQPCMCGYACDGDCAIVGIMKALPLIAFRSCYFTAESTNKKVEFMKCLNSFYKLACLQCSFSDKEVGECIQRKKRECPRLPKKHAVMKVGKQADGT